MRDLNVDAITKTLAVEMTARTSELWRAVITEHISHIESPSACLSLSEDWRTHRLRIHATTPTGTRESTTGETITCDPGRKAEAIAKDICNRILPHAREHMIESQEYDRERKLKEAIKNLRLNMLRKYLPNEYQHDKLSNGGGSRANIFAQLTYENLVNIEINVSLTQALQILKFVKSL